MAGNSIHLENLTNEYKIHNDSKKDAPFSSKIIKAVASKDSKKIHHLSHKLFKSHGSQRYYTLYKNITTKTKITHYHRYSINKLINLCMNSNWEIFIKHTRYVLNVMSRCSCMCSKTPRLDRNSILNHVLSLDVELLVEYPKRS